MNRPVLVCFAVAQEAKPFQRSVSGECDIHVLVTGMGRENARRAARDFLNHTRPGFVLTCGFAGALDPSLRACDIIYRTADAAIASALKAAGARPAEFCTSDRIAVTAAEKAALRAASGADAVEMESGYVEEVCREAGVPCAIVRAVSDEAGEELPLDFNRLLTPRFTLSPMKLALAIVKRPASIPGLMRLGRNSSSAANRLAAVLSKVIG